MQRTARRAAMLVLSGGAVATFAGWAGASYSSTVLSDNPLAYYRLDDAGTAVADSSGNGHNGAVTQGGASDPTRQTASLLPTDPGDTSTTFHAGGTRAAIGGFDHSPAAGNTTTAGFSVEFLVNFTSLPTTQYTNLVGDRTAGLNFELMVYTDLNAGNVYFRPHYNTTNGYGNPDVTSTPIVAGHTYDVVSTYNQSTDQFIFYLDGKAAYSAPGNGGTLINTSNPLYFGYDDNGDNSTAPATLDEVAIYNYALSNAQVASHFAAVPEPATLALVALTGVGLTVRRPRRR